MTKNHLENVCPICHNENLCNVKNIHQCWCMTIPVPKELISRLPEEMQGKHCICQQCIMQFINSENKFER